MRSVADALRTELRDDMARRTPEARLALALELGDADVAALSEARGLTLTEAKARIAARRRVGRQPSVCHDP